MDIHVSLNGRRDLAGEIYRQLRAAILEGRLLGGEPLPPTRELAARLDVARTTVNVAYERLIAEGFAVARVGSGTYVANNLSPAASTRTQRPAALQPLAKWESVPLPSHMWTEAKYDFRPGPPDARAFPYESWRRMLTRELTADAGNSSYGDPHGHRGLREAIVRHVAISRAVRAEAEDVLITSGTQQAVDLIARVLATSGDRVCVEDPSYGTPRRLLQSLGLEVCGVPVDEEGLVVEAIPPDTRFVYVSPSHQFPLGMSMSLRRRVALLEWAKQANAAIIEDDYDSEFRFDGRPIEPIHSLDSDGRVIYVGSFSKTMLPSLRLGFVIAPPSMRDALVRAKYLADWNSPLPTQAAMARFIEEGLFARHLRRMRKLYEARHRLVIKVLHESFAQELMVIPSTVGLHVGALARTLSVEQLDEVVLRASQRGFECMPVAKYSAGGKPLSGLAIGYGSIGVERIEEGLGVLRDAWPASTARTTVQHPTSMAQSASR